MFHADFFICFLIYLFKKQYTSRNFGICDKKKKECITILLF
jgi:hypothetical protein